MVFYGFLGLLALAIVWWFAQSPVTRALLRGRGTDPTQFGTAADHIDDLGLGVSWRSDGRGGMRESKILSKHTRRKR
jgi:hypothetical protein